MGLAALNMVSCLIFPYEITLCINNNDNHMTFVGHIVCLCPLSSFAPSLRSGANLGHKWTICPTQVMWLSYYDPPNTKDGKMARFAFRTASSLLFGGMGVCLFHSVLSKIVSYFFECFGWKLKYYVYQHLEIVCKCWYLVNTRSVVQRKKESHSSKKGSVLNLILL